MPADDLLDSSALPTSFTPAPDDVLLNQPEVARYLRVSVPTLERWRKVGIGPTPLRVGHAIRYRLSDISPDSPDGPGRPP